MQKNYLTSINKPDTGAIKSFLNVDFFDLTEAGIAKRRSKRPNDQ